LSLSTLLTQLRIRNKANAHLDTVVVRNIHLKSPQFAAALQNFEAAGNRADEPVAWHRKLADSANREVART
jgi:hypothetical protein